MSPSNLGIWASQISGHLYSNSYEAIQTVTVGAGGASSVSFTSIPSTYKHLQIRLLARSTFNNAAFGTCDFYVTDATPSSTVTYLNAHSLRGDGANASAYVATGSLTLKNSIPTAITAANTFGVAVVDILDYANTNKNITVRTLGGADLNGATPGSSWNGGVCLTSELITRTLATSALTLVVDGNFVQYSSFALYGIKG